MDDAKTHYEILGVAESASVEEIDAAHKQLLANYHPDRVGHLPDYLQWVKDEAKTHREQIDDALYALIDTHKRRQYDEALKALRERHREYPPDDEESDDISDDRSAYGYAGAPPPPPASPPQPVGTYPSSRPPSSSAVSSSVSHGGVSRGWAIALGWVAGFFFLQVMGPFIGQIMLGLLPRTPNGFGWLGLLWTAGCSVLFGILVTSLFERNRAQAGAAAGLAALFTVVTIVILAAVGASSNVSPTTETLVGGKTMPGNVVGAARGSGNGNSENERVVPVLSGDISSEIRTAINHWRDAIISNDPSRLADCYAGTLDRYFLQTNVTHDYVKQYIMSMHNRGDFYRSEQISQISLQRISGAAVEAQFIETFDSTSAGVDKHATVRTILHFTNEAGGWKISYERQLNLAPENTAINNASVQNTTSVSDNTNEPATKTGDNSATAPSVATHPDQMPVESGPSNTRSLESGPAVGAPITPDPSTSQVPYRARTPIPPQIMIRTDADRRGTLTIFPDHIEYRDEGMGTNGGHAPYGPNSDNSFTLSCAEILGIKAYGFRPVLFGSYQVVITARSGKYHIPTLHSQPIVQGIQNRCGVGNGDSIQNR
jgi:ketosteroid isomerase-like protein